MAIFLKKLCYNVIYVKNAICDNSPMQKICEKFEKSEKCEKSKKYNKFS